MIEKQRNREKYTFANINLLGKCNANCYFCLGKDIDELLSLQNQTQIHFGEWKNFKRFLDVCKKNDIKKLYITGQNTDALIYKYFEELVEYLKNEGFLVGIRTNGYLAEQKLNLINKCNDEIGYSIHSLNPEKNYKIMGHRDFPNWEYIIPNTKPVTRVAIVVNRYNVDEFFDLVKYISKFDNVSYIQARRISTDTRYEEMEEDIKLYEELYNKVKKEFPKLRDFYSAEIFEIYEKEVCFWRTVQTTVNSINYFTDGTLSEEYFVVEGYLKNMNK